MSLSMNQVHGLGQAAEIVAAVLGPVVTGGADIYRTHEESKVAKEALEQRQKEAERLAKLERERFEAQERARLMEYHAALQRSALRGAWWERNMPLLIGGGILITLGLVASRKR